MNRLSLCACAYFLLAGQAAADLGDSAIAQPPVSIGRTDVGKGLQCTKTRFADGTKIFSLIRDGVVVSSATFKRGKLISEYESEALVKYCPPQ